MKKGSLFIFMYLLIGTQICFAQQYTNLFGKEIKLKMAPFGKDIIRSRTAIISQKAISKKFVKFNLFNNVNYYGTLDSTVKSRRKVLSNYYNINAKGYGYAIITSSPDGDKNALIVDGGNTYTVSVKNNISIIEQLRNNFTEDKPLGEGSQDKHGFKILQDYNNDHNPIAYVDVMIVYTDSVAKAVNDMPSFIQLAFDQSNKNLKDSGVNVRLRLAKAIKVNYKESGDMITDMTHLTYFHDGVLDSIPIYAKKYNADIVSMWVKHASLGGLSEQLAGLPPDPNSINTFRPNIVRYDAVLGNDSFLHEIGHDMGARHDWLKDPTNVSFTYNHGYYSAGAHVITIMSYGNAAYGKDGPYTHIPLFSNPDLIYKNYPLGIPAGEYHAADNRKTLNNTASTIANIAGPQIRIMSFNSGVVMGPATIVLNQDSTYNIRWETNINDNFSIDLLKDGEFYKNLGMVSGKDSVFKWTVSNNIMIGKGYTIRMMAKSDSSEFDVNNSPIRITNKKYYLAISNPYEGSYMYQGDNHNSINWKTNIKDDSTAYKVYVLRNKKTIDSLGIVHSTVPVWRVSPLYQTDGKYQILIKNTKYNINDTSGVFFLQKNNPKIYDTKVHEYVEVGGVKNEGPMQNSDISIIWNTNVDGDLKLELYKDGSFYKNIIDTLKYNYNSSEFSNYFSFKYLIGEDITPGNNYSVRFYNYKYGIDIRSDTFLVKKFTPDFNVGIQWPKVQVGTSNEYYVSANFAKKMPFKVTLINQALNYSKVIDDSVWIGNYGLFNTPYRQEFKIPDPIEISNDYRLVLSIYNYNISDTSGTFSIYQYDHNLGIKDLPDSVVYDDNIYPLFVRYKTTDDTVSIKLVGEGKTYSIYRDILKGENYFEGQDSYKIINWKILSNQYPAGRYFLRVSNQYGISAQTDSFLIEHRKNYYVFNKGWNLIGIAGSQDTLQADSLLGSRIIYNYNNGYKRSTSLQNGLGYWMYAGQSDTVNYPKNPKDSVWVQTNKGWNLIGGLQYNISTYFLKLNGGTINNYAYEYDNGYKLTRIIKPGKGYWIFVPSPGNLLLKNESIMPKSAGFNLSKFNLITFSDSTGVESRIYFSANRDSTNYLLPPLAPGHIFDARLTTDSLISYNNKITVRLNNAEGGINMYIKDNEKKTYTVKAFTVNSVYFYSVKGDSRLSIPASVERVVIYNDLLTGINNIKNNIPTEYKLSNNYPNPFNPTTNIKYSLPKAGHVLLQIYNTLGQRVATLVDKKQNAGIYNVTFDASHLASGLYFYRIKAGSFVKTQKMILLK